MLRHPSRPKWDAVADFIAKRYARDLPEDIQTARELELVIRAWRLELEMAFVRATDAHGLLDPALDTKAVRNYIAPLSRIVPSLFGGARSWEEETAKRQRMGLMRFVQLWVDGELIRWPRPSSDRAELKILKRLPSGPERLALRTHDQLDVTWKETRAGAEPGGGRSKWLVLSNVFTDAWGDTTPPTPLTKEWVEGRTSIGRARSYRYCLFVPNADDAFAPHDEEHEAHRNRRPSHADCERAKLSVHAGAVPRAAALATPGPRTQAARPRLR